MKGLGRLLRRSRLLSPRGLLLRALMLLAVFSALHLAGARQYTSVFSGTSPAGADAGSWPLVVGALYALFYLLAVVLAPIMILASASSGALHLFVLRRRKRASDSRPRA